MRIFDIQTKNSSNAFYKTESILPLPLAICCKDARLEETALTCCRCCQIGSSWSLLVRTSPPTTHRGAILITKVIYEAPPYRVSDRGVIADIWKRDSGKCCITGFSGSLLDPLVVVPILPKPKPIQNSLHEMLSVFTGPEIQQRILSHDDFPHDLQKYWLVRKSAAVAWLQGWFQFRFNIGSRAVSRFAKPVRWTLVAREIAEKEPLPQRSINVPFCPRLHLSEPVFASFVPRPLDLVSNGRMSYLLTSRLPGLRLGAFIDTLSDDEANMLVCDLQRCVGELRAIPKDFGSRYAISNALGQPCYDFRIIMGVGPDKERGDFIGPFADEDEFNRTLQTAALPGVSHRSGHKMVFTHSDLNMRNVLMHNGRLSGIVDWENAGWFPEYWDYTKAHFITKLKQRWLRIVDEIFKKFGDYESELATERRFWEYCY
ncbi:Protein kinase-like domain protein [Niveomyces insectorum RCEF 264]|uniref:Protein kinase-like domain protein n=1 Tax=Niveomyces insectorum RCEF 264 TaxID=1081102 RepID=A0A167NSI0_9HYPO|nr:Protein kinase-like domain protein [Niveomyces insectorum RCEF 264]